MIVGSYNKPGAILVCEGEPGKTDEKMEAKNPYVGKPSSGITLPTYYQPAPSVKISSSYFPSTEGLDPDEVRISFLGNSSEPTTRAQAGTCIMVALGNGKRFFSDVGPGCLRNIVAKQVSLPLVNDIFHTHLHIDHFTELHNIFCFSPLMGRWKPLCVCVCDRAYRPLTQERHHGDGGSI